MTDKTRQFDCHQHLHATEDNLHNLQPPSTSNTHSSLPTTPSNSQLPPKNTHQPAPCYSLTTICKFHALLLLFLGWWLGEVGLEIIRNKPNSVQLNKTSLLKLSLTMQNLLSDKIPALVNRAFLKSRCIETRIFMGRQTFIFRRSITYNLKDEQPWLEYFNKKSYNSNFILLDPKE